MTTFNTAAVSLILFFYSLSIHAFPFSLFFFFNDTATTEIYTLSLHDALPILYNKVKYNPNVVGILIINPDNPTGMVYPLKTLQRIVEIAREFDLFLIADEIYINITYNGTKAYSLAEVIGDVPGISMKGISKEM